MCIDIYYSMGFLEKKFFFGGVGSGVGKILRPPLYKYTHSNIFKIQTTWHKLQQFPQDKPNINPYTTIYPRQTLH